MIAGPKTAINLWRKRSLASPDLLGLLAPANMQCCNAAAQIFKTNFNETCCPHHFSERLLIRKL
jgi:hypothetical protein